MRDTIYEENVELLTFGVTDNGQLKLMMRVRSTGRAKPLVLNPEDFQRRFDGIDGTLLPIGSVGGTDLGAEPSKG